MEQINVNAKELLIFLWHQYEDCESLQIIAELSFPCLQETSECIMHFIANYLLKIM
jgi:hypothetical protein